MHSIYLFLYVFFAIQTKNIRMNVPGNILNRKQIYEQMMSENLMKYNLYKNKFTEVTEVYSSVTKEVSISVTREETSVLKPVSHITLKPEVNKLLNVSFSRLKPPSVDNIKFLLENKSVCEVKNLTVIIMIHSAPKHFDERKAIRETWTNARRYSLIAEIRTIFIIGRLQNSALQALVEKEFMEYGDILQGNFVDDYKNLSLSSFYGYKWINQNCANAKYVMKADDDIVINMKKLLHAVTMNIMFIKRTREVACYRIRGIVHKDKESKFYAGEHIFMNTNVTLPFCEGKFVFMTMDLIPDLLESASITPLFWIEDIYWYGLVMANIPDITYLRMNWGDKIEDDEMKAVECLIKNDNCTFFLTLAFSEGEIKHISHLMEKRDKYTYTAKDFINVTADNDIVLLS